VIIGFPGSIRLSSSPSLDSCEQYPTISYFATSHSIHYTRYRTAFTAFSFLLHSASSHLFSHFGNTVNKNYGILAFLSYLILWSPRNGTVAITHKANKEGGVQGGALHLCKDSGNSKAWRSEVP
jgi:hypothetical protein